MCYGKQKIHKQINRRDEDEIVVYICTCPWGFVLLFLLPHHLLHNISKKRNWRPLLAGRIVPAAVSFSRAPCQISQRGDDESIYRKTTDSVSSIARAIHFTVVLLQRIQHKISRHARITLVDSILQRTVTQQRTPYTFSFFILCDLSTFFSFSLRASRSINSCTVTQPISLGNKLFWCLSSFCSNTRRRRY